MITFLCEIVKDTNGTEPETRKVTFVTNELDNITKGEIAGLCNKTVKITIEEM